MALDGKTGGSGDEIDLDALCAELGPPLYRLALARTGKPEEAEDLVQDALLRYLDAVRRRPIDDPLRWALRCVTHGAERRGRHGWRWVRLEETGDPPDAAADPEVLAQADLSNAALAFGQLRPRDRAHVAIVDLDNWTAADLARLLGKSESGARMRVLRSRERLALAYLKQAVGFAPLRTGCERAGVLIPKACAGTLEARRTEELSEHLASCSACTRARDELARLLRDGLTALLPVPPDLARRLRGRLTAALIGRGRRRRGWALLPGRDRGDRRRRGRLALVLLILLLCVVLVTPHGPLELPVRFQVASARGVPLLSPEPALSPPQSPALPSPLPSPPPAALAVAVGCRAAAAGTYAYLDRGEVYLCSGMGASPQRLTSTGGRVDYYWWSPNGALLAYKVAAGASTLGTVSILSIASRRLLATLWRQAIFFSFSPDSAAWISVAPAVSSTAYGGRPGFDSFEASVGRVGDQGPTASFPVAGIPGDTEPWPGNYAELPDLPDAAADEPWGVYWLADAIYLDQGGGGQMTHTFTAAGDASDPWTMEGGNLTLQDRLWGIPADSAFALHPASGDPSLYVTSGGKRSLIGQPPLAGPAETLSVSPDGLSALITDAMLYPCRQDNYLVTAGSLVIQLDADCYASLARWRP